MKTSSRFSHRLGHGRQRDIDQDRRPSPLLAVDTDAAAERPYPLLHASKSHTFLMLREIKLGSVVGHGQLDFILSAGQFYDDLLGMGMFASIAKTFLQQAIQTNRDGKGQVLAPLRASGMETQAFAIRPVPYWRWRSR